MTPAELWSAATSATRRLEAELGALRLLDTPTRRALRDLDRAVHAHCLALGVARRDAERRTLAAERRTLAAARRAPVEPL